MVDDRFSLSYVSGFSTKLRRDRTGAHECLGKIEPVSTSFNMVATVKLLIQAGSQI